MIADRNLIPPVLTSNDPAETIIEQACQVSAHIQRLCRDHAEDRPDILAGQAEAIITDAEQTLKNQIETLTQEDDIKSALRRFRSRVNHAIVLTDLLDLASTETHLAWLSNAAGAAVDGTARWLTQQNSTPGLNEGWFLLAMGKLGADELNYSSDIDLIVITLPNAEPHHQEYIRMTRRLTNILSQPTVDGIGWRVDLRLRPDPGATPVAIGRDAAISYYESLARTWERAAFIRARPIAGNIAAGQEFLDEINPFLWRRYLDYTVLEDMRVMLRREKRPHDLLGFNIKNGEGGIRSIEFFTHVQQLIAAGREPALRQRRTDDALSALANGKWIEPEDSTALKEAYLYWRRLEHRLQMIGDAQTHQLPKSEEQMETLARFCGHENSLSFRQAIMALGDDTSRRTATLMTRIGGGGSDDNIISGWLERQDEEAETLIDHLTELGYGNASGMVQVMQGWVAGRIPATRSERSRQVMIRLLPKLLAHFAESDNPDTSFNQFSRLMDALPSGLQFLSLLESNTSLAQTITTVIASAPEIGEDMAQHPMLVDNLMYSAFWDPDIDWQARGEELKTSLAEAPDYEERLNILRRKCREWKFQVSLHLLTETINSDDAGTAFSRIAELLIISIMPHVEAHLAERYGTLDQGGLVILALGRLGAEDMTSRSDLDLIFIHEADTEAVSSGRRSVAASVWYMRLGQQLINALTAQTAEGRCYSVDMRLRPSGNSGPVAIHIDGFEQYQLNEAWLWEHMALLKARAIGGLRDDTLQGRVQDIIAKALNKPRRKAAMFEEITSMRKRIKKHFPANSPMDIRYCEGGLMDLDFLIQSLQLLHATEGLPLCHSTRTAIPLLSEKDFLDKETAKVLAHSAQQLNALQQWIRLTMAEDRSTGKETGDMQKMLPKPLQDCFGITTTADAIALIGSLTAPVSTALDNLLQHDETGDT